MSNNKQAKEGAKFIDKLNLNHEDFPGITERLMKWTMRYYLS